MMQKDQNTKLEYQCCFCGEKITSGMPDPVRMALFLEDDSIQELYTHLNCLRTKLHMSVPLGIVDDS